MDGMIESERAMKGCTLCDEMKWFHRTEIYFVYCETTWFNAKLSTVKLVSLDSLSQKIVQYWKWRCSPSTFWFRICFFWLLAIAAVRSSFRKWHSRHQRRRCQHNINSVKKNYCNRQSERKIFDSLHSGMCYTKYMSCWAHSAPSSFHLTDEKRAEQKRIGTHEESEYYCQTNIIITHQQLIDTNATSAAYNVVNIHKMMTTTTIGHIKLRNTLSHTLNTKHKIWTKRKKREKRIFYMAVVCRSMVSLSISFCITQNTIIINFVC